MGLADQLTIARAGAVPIVAALYISSFHWHDYWATGLFCLAMSTDWFDGRIARSRGRTSELGSLIVLIGRGVFPAWMLAAIVARELLVSGLRVAALGATRSRGGPCSSRSY